MGKQDTMESNEFEDELVPKTLAENKITDL